MRERVSGGWEREREERNEERRELTRPSLLLCLTVCIRPQISSHTVRVEAVCSPSAERAANERNDVSTEQEERAPKSPLSLHCFSPLLSLAPPAVPEQLRPLQQPNYTLQHPTRVTRAMGRPTTPPPFSRTLRPRKPLPKAKAEPKAKSARKKPPTTLKPKSSEGGAEGEEGESDGDPPDAEEVLMQRREREKGASGRRIACERYVFL